MEIILKSLCIIVQPSFSMIDRYWQIFSFYMNAEINYSDISFTKENFRSIVALMRGKNDDIKVGLSKLATILTYGDSNTLSHFPVSDVSRLLSQLLSSDNCPEIIETSAKCVFHLLEAHPDSTRNLISNDILSIMAVLLSKPHSRTTADFIIRAFGAISQYRPKDIGAKIGLAPLLKVCTELRLPEMRTLSLAVDSITKAGIFVTYGADLQYLIPLIVLPDPMFHQNILSAFLNIIRGIDVSKIPESTFVELVKMTRESIDSNTALTIFESISKFTMNGTFSELFLQTTIDFDFIFHKSDYGQNTEKIRSIAMGIILDLLPMPELPAQLVMHHKNPITNPETFAKQVQPFLMKLCLEETTFTISALEAFASSLVAAPFDPPIEFLSSLKNYVLSPITAPYVLSIALALPDPTDASCANLLPVFLNEVKNHKEKDWFAISFQKLLNLIGPAATVEGIEVSTKYETIDELLDFFDNNKIEPLDFVITNLLQITVDLIKKTNITSFNEKQKKSFEKIADISQKVLFLLRLQSPLDPIGHYAPEVLITRSTPVTIKAENEKTYSDINVSFELDFNAIEGWYNKKRDYICNEGIYDAICRSKIKDNVAFDNILNLSNSHLGVLIHGIKVDRGRKYLIEINGQQFSCYDNFFYAIARALPSMDRLSTQQIVIQITSGQTNEVYMHRITMDLPDDVRLTLELLDLLHKIIPKYEFQTETLGKLMRPLLSSLFSIVGFHSPAAKIIYHYPFLFPFDLRLALFKIVGTDTYSSFSYFNQYFLDKIEPIKTNNRVKCYVDRNTIFADGSAIFTTIALGHLRLDVSFVNENGIGSGPTQEFITLFSTELCKHKYHIWRSDKKNDDEYVNDPNGLFPSPDADPQHMFMLGVLCGKAILMGMIVNIRFNPAFIKLVQGHKVSVEEIDQQIAKSLEVPDYLIGLDFSYPGLPNLDMIPNGSNIEVSKENAQQYVDLVKEYTCGSKIQFLVDEFKRGLSTNIHFEAINFLYPQEVITLIAGKQKTITKEELENHVIIAHGYGKNSPQILMLFEIILEMDIEQTSMLIKFITGSNCLPVDGLKGLNPKLTIAKRIVEEWKNDESFPSVMTCMNYFKLPEYSSKEIMKQKLLYAISEGQNVFAFT